jgi:hypothetical protein
MRWLLAAAKSTSRLVSKPAEAIDLGAPGRARTP